MRAIKKANAIKHMPKVIYPAGINILNVPIDNKIIPAIKKISSKSFIKVLPKMLNILIKISPP